MASSTSTKPLLEDILASIPSQERLDEKISDDVHLELIGAKILNWKGLRAFLGLTEQQEEAIDHDVHRTERKRVAMLQTWREQKGVHATYRNLAGAFYVAGRINLIWEVCELLGARPSPSSSYEDVQELRKPPVRRRGGPASHSASSRSVDVLKPEVQSGRGDAQLGDSDLREITEYLAPLSKTQVTALGVQLGLSYRWLSDREDFENYRCDVADAWLKMQDNVLRVCPPTWRNLVSALQKVNQNGIAIAIARERT